MASFLRRLAPRVSWTILGGFFIAFIVSFYMMFLVLSNRYMGPKEWYHYPAPCVQPEKTIEAMVKLAFKTSDILTKLSIPHTLCYGTLWGALRNAKVLPWDNNIDLCVMKGELDKVGFKTLAAAFQVSNLELTYDARHGEYSVMTGSAHLLVNMFYTTVWDEVLHDGWEHRLLWFFQEEPITFPYRLLQHPFPKTDFHGREMPVPHDELEILKYLYRKDWWLEKPPPGCESTYS